MSSRAREMSGTPTFAWPPERSIRQQAPTVTPPCSVIAAMHSRDDSPVVTMSSTIRQRVPGSIRKPRLSVSLPSTRSKNSAGTPSWRPIS